MVVSKTNNSIQSPNCAVEFLVALAVTTIVDCPAHYYYSKKKLKTNQMPTVTVVNVLVSCDNPAKLIQLAAQIAIALDPRNSDNSSRNHPCACHKQLHPFYRSL